MVCKHKTYFSQECILDNNAKKRTKKFVFMWKKFSNFHLTYGYSID